MRNNIMKKTILATALLGVLSTSAWAAEPASDQGSREENIGVASGFAVGALVGGPPGAIVGAVGGYLFGHGKTRSHQLQQAQQQAAQLRGELETQKKLAEAQAQKLAEREQHGVMVASAGNVPLGLTPDPVKAIEQGFAFTIEFRSGSDELEPHFQDQLASLAGSLQQLPELQVYLDGYADPRGTDADNLSLSERRATSVRTALVAAGLDAARIHTSAHGEAKPLQAGTDPEAFGFERRVVISFQH